MTNTNVTMRIMSEIFHSLHTAVITSDNHMAFKL